MYILGLSEGAFFGWIGVVVTVLGVFISASHIFIRYKQKADNADTMKTVDEKIIEELKPIESSIKSLEKNVNSLNTKTEVMDERYKNIESGISDIKQLISQQNTDYKKQFENVWKVIQTKKDK